MFPIWTETSGANAERGPANSWDPGDRRRLRKRLWSRKAITSRRWWCRAPFNRTAAWAPGSWCPIWRRARRRNRNMIDPVPSVARAIWPPRLPDGRPHRYADAATATANATRLRAAEICSAFGAPKTQSVPDRLWKRHRGTNKRFLTRLDSVPFPPTQPSHPVPADGAPISLAIPRCL